ncbi:hypothetical protein [Sediminibacterium ginsengisoli]|uniref:Uncharacterized protein n=1 Tax=Sediminibacterium ginsengisoli TaxID=413434 RepID=A0A1T4R8F1_9BACT|nr:hypothetical protein [Sediminibacterium ginsengisoli]SKA11948.1 hypothetical protein SAMN04488132_1113 [Sediminibacterium ginsengisoli]
MKSNVMPSIVQIEAEELKKLVTEVKETVATDVIANNNNTPVVFGAVDLWKIRRSVKTARLRWEF